jgi:hypothetical protein
MEEHVPAEQRTRANTGHCSVCLQNIKLRGGKIVLHGYKRPGHGATEGSCFGVGYPPYELSDKGTKAYMAKEIKPNLVLWAKKLKDLKSGKIKTLMVGGRNPKEVTPEDPKWQRSLDNETRRTERSLSAVKMEEGRIKTLISKWRVRDLPVEGDRIFKF